MIKAPIVEALQNACDNPTKHFHIPGHAKGGCVLEEFKSLVGEKVMCVDTTDEFDNLGTLHPATGPIKEAQELAAAAFGAKRTFFLLNGSTAGNLAFGMGLTHNGQKVIVNRNCHRSILAGLIISGAQPLWLTPNRLEEWGLWGSVEPEQVEKMLQENKDVGLVWITNPTYEGVMSDISAIAQVCKKYDVPLVVDEAHACLWYFSDKLPTGALELGVDAVLHSLHKTGGSMSQSSMMHIAHNSKLDVSAVEKALKLVQTTSPSLLLLASLDAARANLQSPCGRERLENAISNAEYLRGEIDKMRRIDHLSCQCLAAGRFARLRALDARSSIKTPHQVRGDMGGLQTDVTKVFIKADGLSGVQLESILEIDFGIEVESAFDKGLLLLSNIGNSREDMEYLVQALKKIDETEYKEICEEKRFMPLLEPVVKMGMREAFFSKKETVAKANAVGRIAAEVIAECPPGIAVLLPGELITEAHLPYLVDYGFLDVVK